MRESYVLRSLKSARRIVPEELTHLVTDAENNLTILEMMEMYEVFRKEFDQLIELAQILFGCDD